ncbi:sulfotransferase family 2 domain-containing protein [Candidatus Woesearchaeota archaeon]|jgi:hypothetical protein|nr:sulfotransferase family 2 domain-containing protein [Candidatus Woesearchaeota archaeon]
MKTYYKLRNNKRIGTFIHIPRSAGKTFRDNLGEYFIRKDEKHATALYVRENYPTEEELPMISCVRNPWQRIWSLFNYTRMISQTKDTIHMLEWDEWLKTPIVNNERRNHYRDVVDRNHLSSATYLFDRSGELIVDHILRFENLEEDVNRICDSYKITDVRIDMSNKFSEEFGSTSDGWKEHYTDEQRQYVEEICSWEIKEFGYKFE